MRQFFHGGPRLESLPLGFSDGKKLRGKRQCERHLPEVVRTGKKVRMGDISLFKILLELLPL